MADTMMKFFNDASKTSLTFLLVKDMVTFDECICLHGTDHTWLLGDGRKIKAWLKELNIPLLFTYDVCVNSMIPLKDIDNEVRIEPGSIIREGAVLDTGCIILMGAVVNVGAQIGADTMIDMNAVIGSGAIVGKRVHVGAGAVIAGMLEPACKDAVTIEDDVMIGANAVILEGIHVGRGAIIGAGSVVTHDVPNGMVVQGVPARVVKAREEVQTAVSINQGLR